MIDIAAVAVDSAFWVVIDHWALAIVAIGVILEGIAEWLPKDRREAPFITKLTRTGWLVLVSALIIEYVAQPAELLISVGSKPRPLSKELQKGIDEAKARGDLHVWKLPYWKGPKPAE